MVKPLPWQEWICHSNFSFLTGASHPLDLLKKATEFNYHGLCLTDYDGVYGIARLYRDKQKLQKLGLPCQVQLRYGAELHLRPDHDRPIYEQDTLILIATSHRGYTHLCQILTEAHAAGKNKAFLPLTKLARRLVDDLVVIQPMRGVIRSAANAENKIRRKERWTLLKDHFQDRFYFAVSRHLNQAEDCWIDSVLDLSKQWNQPVLMSQDIFFHDAGQKRISDLLHAIRHNQPLDAVSEQLFVNSHRRPHDQNWLRKVFGELPCFEQALIHSQELSDQIHFDLDELRYQYPKEMIPDGYTAQEYLEALTWEQAHIRYGHPLPAKLKHLLRHELDLVQTLDFADYFLTVHDIVRWARSQDILCQGRGSAANSAICFLLGITALDPTQFELLFERFISVERGDPPDIDVDFEHHRREEVIQYIYRRYGRDKAAMVANVITFRSKGAFRSVGKALGFSENLLSTASKVLSHRSYRWGPTEDAIQVVKTRCLPLGEVSETDHRWGLWADLASQIRGFPRHLGIHSGGFVISDHPLCQLCPEEPATMEGRTVITWSKDDIEGLGFFKIDILALGGLTLIKKCFEYLKAYYDQDLTLDTIPANDPATYAMICQADTVGTFQIESRAQMSFLPRHQPQNFYDLVVQVAIIRPGPIQGGMIHPYLRRRTGEEPVTFPDPRLEPILKRTYGVPIFQEQVMRVAIAVGGFTPGEADELRKNIGSFKMNVDPDLWVERLAQGMRKNKIAEEFIETIMGHIKGFSSYGFPESHAASFALLGYATAYLKCHHPDLFFTAILNAQPLGFYMPDTLLRVAKQSGVQIFPIAINESDWDHQLDVLDKPAHGCSYGIRLGFRLVRGLSKSGIADFLKRRRKLGPWTNLEKFIKQNRLSRLDLTALAAANALRCFDIERKDALWIAEAAPFSEWLEPSEDHVLFEVETELETTQLDFAATSVSLGHHPAELIKRTAWVYDLKVDQLILASQVKKPALVGRLIKVFGMVTVRQAPPTAKGMMFITLWDETGSFDLVIQPPIYKRYYPLIDGLSFLCVSGQVQRQRDAYSILVKHIWSPDKLESLHNDYHPVRNYH